MEKFTVDFSNIEGADYFELRDKFYVAIKKAFYFPDWCGHNSSAIWDMIIGTFEGSSIIYIKGFNNIPKIIQREADIFLKILGRTKKYYTKLNRDIEIEFID